MSKSKHDIDAIHEELGFEDLGCGSCENCGTKEGVHMLAAPSDSIHYRCLPCMKMVVGSINVSLRMSPLDATIIRLGLQELEADQLIKRLQAEDWPANIDEVRSELGRVLEIWNNETADQIQRELNEIGQGDSGSDLSTW